MKLFKSVNIGEICVDISSDFTSIYIKGEEKIFKESSSIAYNTITGEVEAFGDEALLMEGRTSDILKTVHPVKNGVICDFDCASELFLCLIKKALENKLLKPKIMVTISPSLTAVEEKALIDVLYKSGARQILGVDSLIATALGEGMDVTLKKGIAVLDIGDDITEIGVISESELLVHNKLNLGKKDFFKSIFEYVKNKFNILISPEEVQKIKEQALFLGTPKAEFLTISGVDTVSHLPRKIKLPPLDADTLFSHHIKAISGIIADTLLAVPKEMLSDILSDGILLSGSGADISGLSDMLFSESEVKVANAKNTALSKIKGAGILMENMDRLFNLANTYHNE